MSERITFGDWVITDDYVVIITSRPIPGVRNETVTVPGRRGDVFLGATLTDLIISIRVIFDGNVEDRRKSARDIASKLLTTELTKLEFESDKGLYYMALVNNQPNWREFIHSGSIDVQFLVPDPAMYGEEKTATVPSGGSTTVQIGGTAPTYPVVSVTATRNSSTNLWGLRIDDRDYMRLDTGSNAARVVKINAEERTATVSGSTTMITTDSDWMILTPGDHKIANDQGTGIATLTWTERWL